MLQDDYEPEVIMNNFTTRLGHSVARMINCLIPQKPDFHGRRVMTYHNQRDFIFFRHHRYYFSDLFYVIYEYSRKCFFFFLKFMFFEY